MNKFGQTLIILLLGIAIGGTYHEDLQLTVNKLIGFTNSETVSKVNQIELDEIKGGGSKVSICFTPSENCGQMIVDQINQAKKTIYMQAYGLTHPQITNALIKAKQRGLNVRILLDRSNLTQKHSKIKELEAVGIEVTIDRVAGIAHNKIVILDNHTTITGSFNFTVSASTRNAENVLIINDSNVARSYLQNWQYRKAAN